MDICTHLAAVIFVVLVVAAAAVAVAHVVEPRRLQQNEKANLL